MKSKQDIELLLAAAWDNYISELYEIADKYHDECKHEFERRGITMLSGNGVYVLEHDEYKIDTIMLRIEHSDGEHENITDKLLIEIIETLSLCIKGLPCNDLGSLA